MKHPCEGCQYFWRGFCTTDGERAADPGHHWCLRNEDPDDCLDLALEAQARTLDRLEREIFETEKNALTDWHGRLGELHKKHFEAARQYEAITARMKELHSPTSSHVSDGLPF